MPSDFVRPGRIDKLREELAKEKNEKIELRAAMLRFLTLSNRIEVLEADVSHRDERIEMLGDKNRQLIAAWLLREAGPGVTLSEAEQLEAYRHAPRVVIESVDETEAGAKSAAFRFDSEVPLRELPAKPLEAVPDPPPADTPDTAAPGETATEPEPGPGPRALGDPAESIAPV
jgi:hypothetical protein